MTHIWKSVVGGLIFCHLFHIAHMDAEKRGYFRTFVCLLHSLLLEHLLQSCVLFILLFPWFSLSPILVNIRVVTHVRHSTAHLPCLIHIPTASLSSWLKFPHAITIPTRISSFPLNRSVLFPPVSEAQEIRIILKAKINTGDVQESTLEQKTADNLLFYFNMKMLFWDIQSKLAFRSPR